jgi:GT2 family glycosyltransferase
MKDESVLDIVIVNWNSGALLRECVASLGESARTAPPFRVVVVDNGSVDGSADQLDAGPAPLTVCRNATNRGFAAACNQGAAQGAAPFVLFLNPDTRVTGEALADVLAYMRSPASHGVGICGIALTSPTGEVSRSCSRHPTPWRMIGATLALDRVLPRIVRPHALVEFDHRSGRPVEQVIGAFFLVRRELYEQLGGFDERFFVYYEEVDFTYRASLAGVGAYFLADTSAFHLGGGTTDRVRAFRQFLVTRSRTQYAFKHFSWPLAALHAAAALVTEPVVRCMYSLARRDVSGFVNNAQAALMLWRDLPRLAHDVRRTPAAGRAPAAQPVDVR